MHTRRQAEDFILESCKRFHIGVLEKISYWSLGEDFILESWRRFHTGVLEISYWSLGDSYAYKTSSRRFHIGVLQKISNWSLANDIILAILKLDLSAKKKVTLVS
jgi:hypothetical protein